MTAKTSFRGSFTALVTPFKNGSLDEKAYRDLVEWQIAEGTNGLVPVGTTGESPTLSHDEHKQAVEWCVDQARRRVPVIAGSGSNSTVKRSLARSQLRPVTFPILRSSRQTGSPRAVLSACPRGSPVSSAV